MKTLVFLLFVLVSASAFPSVVYVDKESNSGTEDGTSWATAFTKIQDGIDTAIAGDEVWVARGVYDENRTSVMYDPPTDTGSLLLHPNISLYGGFNGVETEREQRDWEKNVTVIDGVNARSGLPAYHVVFAFENATLDGFTVQGGRSEDPPIVETGHVAGIKCRSDGLTIANCVVRDNLANGIGGLNVFGELSVQNSTFLENSPGGILVVGDFEIQNCEFVSNVSRRDGGAIQASSSDFLISNCYFRDNTTESVGGAIDIVGTGTIDSCVFENNQAVRVNPPDPSQGGAIFVFGNATISNSIFWNNEALEGSAIYIEGNDVSLSSFVESRYNTFVGNGPSTLYAYQSVVWARNSIFVDNELPELILEGVRQDIGVDYCIVRELPEGTRDDGGNLLGDIDPLFLDPENGDFRITEGSPAIDAKSSILAPNHDILGVMRPLGDGWDIGAYEFDPDNPPVLPEEPKKKDDSSNDDDFPPCFIATAA